MSELGKYPNNRADARKEYEAKRTAVTREVGDFLLSLHPTWSTWEVATKNGSPVPKALSGRFTDVHAFRQALARYEGQKVSTASESSDGN